MSDEREQVEKMPEVVRLRDTGLHDDLGGSGQRIITTAGSGYVKTETEYVRHDVVEALRAQLAAARVVTDAMVERFMVAYEIAYRDGNTHRFSIRAALTAALSEAP